MSLNSDLPPVSRPSGDVEVKSHMEVVQSVLGELVDKVEELNPTGRIVFLTGTSTAGKSRVMENLKKAENTQIF